MQYLADKHGALRAPAGTVARAHQDAMLFWLIDEFDALLWAAAKHSFIFPEELRVPRSRQYAQNTCVHSRSTTDRALRNKAELERVAVIAIQDSLEA